MQGLWQLKHFFVFGGDVDIDDDAPELFYHGFSSEFGNDVYLSIFVDICKSQTFMSRTNQQKIDTYRSEIFKHER